MIRFKPFIHGVALSLFVTMAPTARADVLTVGHRYKTTLGHSDSRTKRLTATSRYGIPG